MGFWSDASLRERAVPYRRFAAPCLDAELSAVPENPDPLEVARGTLTSLYTFNARSWCEKNSVAQSKSVVTHFGNACTVELVRRGDPRHKRGGTLLSLDAVRRTARVFRLFASGQFILLDSSQGQKA